MLPGRTTAVWQHVAAPGTLDVIVDGAAHDWSVQLRGVDDFHNAGADRARSRR